MISVRLSPLGPQSGISDLLLLVSYSDNSTFMELGVCVVWCLCVCVCACACSTWAVLFQTV